MPSVTRSKRNMPMPMDMDMDIDHLSGLMTGMNLVHKPKKVRMKKEKDISDMFSGLSLGKSISKTRRHKGMRFTHKKSHKSGKPGSYTNTANMDFGGSRYRRRRRSIMKRRKYKY